MRKKITLLGLLLFGICSAQESHKALGGEYSGNKQTEACITEEQRQEIFGQLRESVKNLEARGILQKNNFGLNHPLFQWPVVKSPDAPYQNTWAISNYVDHNQAFPNQVQDWNCGTRTYDTSAGYNHAGIDIYTWPFTWYQLENNQSWAVAAAPGTIIYKAGSNSDRSCNFNSAQWNAVYIRHADGSIAWYGHLKRNSLTTKAVGQTVETGEFLGVVGSSGNSTGPHLHFEVYNSQEQLVDPYAGTCNTWEPVNDSWWTTQKPYLNTKINAFMTHSAPPVFPTCPNIETPNFKTDFNVGETVYVAVYLTDQLPGTTATIRLTRPNNTVLYNFNQTLNDLYSSSYWYWSFPAAELTQTGTYTVSYTYQGNTVSTTFNYGSLGTKAFEVSKLDFYPNPASDKITFSENINALEVFQLDGKKLNVPHSENSADISSLPSGMFIVKGTDSNGLKFNKKLVK